MTEMAFRNRPPLAVRGSAELSAVVYREYALLARNRVNLILGLAPMLVYLLLVNTSLSSVISTVTYRDTVLPFSVFLLPMVIAMSVVSAAGTTGMALFQEEMSGVATQIWSYPLRRSQFLLGKLLAGASLVLAQGLLAVVVAVLVFRYPFTASSWLVLLGTLVVASFAFNGLYLAAAVLITEYRTFMVLTTISVPVLVFAAPSLSPVQQLPIVLQWISVVNPVTYAVVGMRDAALFGLGTAWPSVLVLAVVAVVANAVAARGLLRRTESL